MLFKPEHRSVTAVSASNSTGSSRDVIFIHRKIERLRVKTAAKDEASIEITVHILFKRI